MIHLEYCTTGPTEVGRSQEYDDLEVGFSLDEGVVYFMGRRGEDWHDVAQMYQFDGRNRIESLEPGRHIHRNITAVFISPDPV